MRKIGIEEHVNQQDLENLDKRLKDMDEAGVDMQVLSYAFIYDESIDAKEATASARSINDTLAKVVEKYPERFSSFAVVALQDPEAAANELERAVKELGLKGTLIYSGLGGEFLDNQKFWAVLEMAEKLDVPIYLHPGRMSPDMAKPFMDYPILSSSMWGFAVDTGLHAMRLICSGVFDKYQDLKIILGHMGEGIPYWLWRIDNRWTREQELFKDDPATKLPRKPTEYFRDNFYVTTSGMFWHPVLQFVNSVLGADRILFASDYPPESLSEAAQFAETMPLSDSDKEKICHLNAERLLKL